MGARYRKIRSSYAIVTFHFLKFCYVCILNNNNGNSFRAGFQTKTKRMIKKIVGVAAVAAMTAGCSSPQELHQAINLSYMDSIACPKDDFYNYVNGKWMKAAVIPADNARWGSFDELRENTDEAVLGILKISLKVTFEQGSDGQKIADLYKSYVDTENRNRLGFEPIKPYLAKIDAIENLDDLYRYLVEVGPEGGNPFFGGYVYAHMKNSDVNAVYLGGGSLGLGRSYYQKVDEKNTE